MTNGIQVTSLTKWFGDHCAVKSIDFEVPEGEVVALLGPSGCGKTTTLRCLAGLEDPSSGRIDIAGRTAYSSASGANVASEKRGVGLVFQSYALWPHLTVGQNVEYGLKVQRMRKSQISEKVSEILGAVGLSGYADRYPASLSGGQQQRVALARSLVMEPRVLLFDEPLSNLDSKLRESMRHDLRKLIKRIGLTAVYVTHDQSEAMVIADRIILMNDGQIEQDGTPGEMYHHPRSEFAANFIGSANFFDAIVTGSDVGRFRLELGPGQQVWATARDRTLEVGEKVRLAIRPERLRLGPAGAAGENILHGAVVDSEFLGNYSTFEVRCGETRVNVQDSESDVGPGSEVSVSVRERDVIVLEA